MEPVCVSPSTAGLSQGLPQRCTEGVPETLSASVSAGLLRPEVLSSAGAAGLSEDLPESLSPPVLLRGTDPCDLRLSRAQAMRTRHSSELSGFRL